MRPLKPLAALCLVAVLMVSLSGCAAMAGAFIGSSISHAIFEKPKTTTCTTDVNGEQTCVTVQS